MPGNTVRINKRPELDWYVGDSEIENLVDWLNQHGVKNEPINIEITNKIEEEYENINFCGGDECSGCHGPKCDSKV